MLYTPHMLSFNSFNGLVHLLLLFLCVISLPHSVFAVDQWDTITPSGTSGYSFNTIASFNGYVYLGTNNGVYRSLDGGQTWTQINTGLSNQVIRSIAIGFTYDSGSAKYVVSSSTPVFVATAGGVFATQLDGTASTTWTATSTGLTDTDVKDIEIDQYQSTQGSFTTLYVATPSGVFRSINYGSTWTVKNSGMVGLGVTKITSDYGNGKIYALTDTNKLYVSNMYSLSSVDESWTSVFESTGTTTKDISILHGVGQIGWLATNNGILKSDTSGQNWTAKNIGLPSATINTVMSDYLDANIAYAAVSGNGIYRTHNEALQSPQWLPININLSDLEIGEIRTNPNNTNVVYAVGALGAYRLNLSTPYIDLTPPSTISNLAASGNSIINNIVLTWSAPGEDGVYGTSTSYSIRYSTALITEANWASATPVIPQPIPYVYGYATTYYAFNIPGNLQYYFAIKSSDGVNQSALSNVVNVPVYVDTTNPVIPSSLSASVVSSSAVNLTWASSTDNLAVTGYVVYQNSSPIATTTTLSYSVTGLSAGTSYIFEIKAFDAAGLYSSAATISAVTSAVVTPSSGGGDSGGGSGGNSSPVVVAQNVIANINTTSTSTINNVFNPLNNNNNNVVSVPGFIFTRNLLVGSRGEDVKELQKFLNKNGFIIAKTGVGSPGQESIVFGPATRLALIKYQRSKNILPSNGILGLSSRNIINASNRNVSARTTATTATPNNTNNTIRKIFRRNLALKSVGEDVKALQQFLNRQGFTVARKGPGSKGYETTKFGLTTRSALMRFQRYYKVRATGILDIKTRTIIKTKFGIE